MVMDGKTFARIGAVAFVTLVIAATVIEMTRKGDRTESSAPMQQSINGQNQLNLELARCSGLGEAGPRDLSCIQAWADNRRRFFRQNLKPSVPAATDNPSTNDTAPANPPTHNQLAPTRLEVR
jgi:conjugative transfer region protein TrbK